MRPRVFISAPMERLSLQLCPSAFGNKGATAEFAGNGTYQYKNETYPERAGIQESGMGSQPGINKKQRKQHYHAHIADPVNDSILHGIVFGNYDARQEGAE